MMNNKIFVIATCLIVVFLLLCGCADQSNEIIADVSKNNTSGTNTLEDEVSKEETVSNDISDVSTEKESSNEPSDDISDDTSKFEPSDDTSDDTSKFEASDDTSETVSKPEESEVSKEEKPPIETSDEVSDTETSTPSNEDTSYLIFEKQNRGYCVIGIVGNAPKNIIIPDMYDGFPVNGIGDAAGMDCTNLCSVKLPDSVTHIDSRAFWGCTSLNNIDIPNNVMAIGDFAFYQCTNLVSATISNKITIIPDSLFGWCYNLSKVNLPDGITKIEHSAFIQCKNLRTITLPASLMQIENNAFEGSGLTAIIIPASVNSLGFCVFANCENLTSATIGTGITNIPEGTFTGCTNLTNITYAGTKAQWESISFGENWNENVPATKVVCIDGTVSLDNGSNLGPSEPQPIPVTGVQISKTSLNLTVGDTHQLAATISPSNADNKNIIWSSDNTAVAQVSSSGKITAKGEGTAIITVTSVDGNFTAICTITVTASSTTPTSDVLIISDTQTLSNQTIDTDVFITSTGVVTFNNVTVNGNIYCYGQLKASGCTANNIYAYAYGSMMSCQAFDGIHGKISGGISCNQLIIRDNALEYAFDKWGKR